MAVITSTTLLNAITTQNAYGTATNATKTTFQTTTSCFSLEGTLLNALIQSSSQSTVRVYFQYSSQSITASTFAQQCGNPMCLELVPKSQSNTAATFNTPAIPAMGLYLYWWVDIPTITTSGGTLTLILNEHS